jgi:hypothetical protein
VLLSAVGFAGCGGTETGNPIGPAGGGGDRNPAVELEGAVCGKLTDCFGADRDFTAEDCVEAINDSETLGPALGVNEVPPPGYGEVIDKVESSDLLADEEAVEGCLAALDALECEDPEVEAVDIEDGFTNVEEMIPEESCSGVFFVP